MAPRAQFGNTWWGQKWLDALQDIDFSNRLPRGKGYARNGSVVDIQILGNQILARVQGRRRTPYREEILLKPFTPKERRTILQVITENPYYLSRLLNRKLPEELFEEFSGLKIKLFPKRWSDLQATCSCPDWAVPCKHLAAVIYIIANEIDKNPFLIFELHGLNILDELRKQGYGTDASQKKDIHSLSEILKKAKPEWSAGIESPKIPETFFTNLDFSRIPRLWPELVGVLSDQPLFVLSEDFKKVLARAYKTVNRKTTTCLEQGPKFLYGERVGSTRKLFKEPAFDANPETINEIDFCIVEDFASREGTLVGKEKNFPFFSDKLRPLIEFLHQIPADRLADFPPKIALFNVIYRLSLALLKAGAFIPELLDVGNERFAIRWIPAFLNDTVREISEKIMELLPPDSVAVTKVSKTSGKKKDRKQKKEAVRFYPDKKEQFLFLSSLFLDYFVKKFCEEFLYTNPIQELFFGDRIFSAKNFEDQEIPATIQVWLSRLTLSERRLVPVLKIVDTQDGFWVDVLVENREEAVREPFPLKELFADETLAGNRASVLRDLSILADFIPEIRDMLALKGSHSVLIAPGDFPRVFFQILPILQVLGIRVLLPKALRHLVRPRLSVSLDGTGIGTKPPSFLSLNEMLHFNWKIALGDKLLSVKEFEELVKSQKGIVRIHDQFVYLDEKEIRSILNQAQKQRDLTPDELLKIGLEEKFEGARIKISPQSQKIFKELLKLQPVPLPEGLDGTLREYQKRGYEWMLRNAGVGFGSIIADDMGLGKTVQVIAVLLKLKNEKLLDKKALIIVPTTLLTNWKKEIERFAPDLKTCIYHGLGRKLEIDSSDVLLTTYGIIRNENKKFTQHWWKVVIIDEAQNIKNPASGQTRAVKKIKADIRIAMTGTPVENRLLEYWSIFDFINKGYLGGMKYFRDEFAYPIEVFRDQERLNRLLKLTGPFILRRLKTDKSIIQDLPEKLEFERYCSLTKEQTVLYQNVVNENMAQIDKSDGIARQGMVLKLMTALKQICNHPAHYLKHNKVDPELSGKTSLLLDLLKNFEENDEKVLIFTQYREMGKLLFQMIREVFGKEVPFLHGGVPRKKRDEMVELFQNEKRIRTMILSLKAGGTGLNLTAAKNVIHFDLWWNPAVETQATDRAYRIGQTKDVMVYRFLTHGTFEEKINAMLHKKKELAELAVSSGEKWIGELSSDELAEIVQLEQ